MRRLTVTAALLLMSACGGSSSPTSPTPATPTPTPAPATVTVSGHVTATNGGQALSGVNARLGAAAVTTDSAGAFAAPGLSPALSIPLALTGSSIVPRTVTVALTSTRDVSVSAIALAGAFDLPFYRAFVRNGFEAPTGLQPLRRWTVTPNIYLKTVDEAGEAIHGPTLDLIEATVKDAVPRWTGGVLGVPVVTRGTETRVGAAGWITIRFPSTLATEFCGQAQVGVDGGWVEFSYHVPSNAPINCRVPGAVIAPTVVRHELGHALGFWHTDGAADLMHGGSWTDPNKLPSARELYHAAIAYARPVGNVDPDTDPAGAVNLAPLRVR